MEVAVGAFFNGKEFIYPLNVNFEHKKLFPGNIGPSTGEMGTAMFWSGPNKLFNSTLKKMEAKLASAIEKPSLRIGLRSGRNTGSNPVRVALVFHR